MFVHLRSHRSNVLFPRGGFSPRKGDRDSTRVHSRFTVKESAKPTNIGSPQRQRMCQKPTREQGQRSPRSTIGGNTAVRRQFSAIDSPSPRSGRQRKAWGVSPRIRDHEGVEPAEWATVRDENDRALVP
ncbi:MAG: hypothetical protein QOG23_1841 [Blastocatellia bacterium]|jgi:hypothetical protein|nr:hypothetical protein [Blastocatellia bacterium]